MNLRGNLTRNTNTVEPGLLPLRCGAGTRPRQFPPAALLTAGCGGRAGKPHYTTQSSTRLHTSNSQAGAATLLSSEGGPHYTTVLYPGDRQIEDERPNCRQSGWNQILIAGEKTIGGRARNITSGHYSWLEWRQPKLSACIIFPAGLTLYNLPAY